MRKKEVYISVDIEADGPIPGEYSMSSFGAVVVDRPHLTFYRELKPITDRWDPQAAAVSGLNRETLKKDGAHPADALREFADWVASVVRQDERPVFVSFNATFDWMFSHWYFMKYLGHDPFGISGLEMKSYYMGLMGVEWGDTTKRYVAVRFKSKQPHTHNALDDAKEQGEMFAAMLKAGRALAHSRTALLP